MDETFIEAYNDLASRVYARAYANGFWGEEGKVRNFGESIALVHSELSEALEGERMGDPPDDKIPKFTSREAELADAIIRIMDMGEGYDLRIAEALIAKMKFNAGRPYKHGKKF